MLADVPRGASAMSRAVGRAMGSSAGAGPARFHVGGRPGWVDTVYLGAFETDLAREVGGYAEDVGVNEDAEFAFRMGRHGGIWFTPRISSRYTPRSSARAVARQFFRYGQSRAATVRKHPESLHLRQLAAPMLVVGLLSPLRRRVFPLYAGVLAVAALRSLPDGPAVAARLPVVMATMHLSWGAGFLVGVVTDPQLTRRCSR